MEKFIGKWKSESAEGFEDYLKALGVALPLRKIATLQNPVMDISEEDGHYIAKQITVFKTHVVTFLLDTELDEETPDGRRVKTTFTLDDGKLVQTQMLDGAVSSVLTREIIGDKLKVTATAGDAVYTRVYTK